MVSSPSPGVLELPPNYVWRSYRGGSRLRAFRGHPGTPDDHFPEDWLASTVRARNGAFAQGPDEGISRIPLAGGEVALDAFPGDRSRWFGERRDLGVLLKLLDAADRLHVQAHPDDAFVRRRFGGDCGKTECWYVLATREASAHVFLGLQRAVTPAAWERLIVEQDIPGMLALFDPIPVRAGDCLVVPAGVPHAIGAGVFLLELQQPSDWVVRCEFTVGDHTLPPEARFMGLTYPECRDIFDLTPYAADAWRQHPRLLARSARHTEEEVIATPHQGFFRLRRLRGTGPAAFTLEDPAVLVMTAGTGSLDAAAAPVMLGAGRTLLLPPSPAPCVWRPESPSWEFLLAQPPLS